MRRAILICLFLFLINQSATAQGGYVKLYESGDVKAGFLRFVRPPGQEMQLELWNGKNDKDPTRFFMDEISEYSMGKDTFRIIRNFQPFPGKDIFFEIAEAKIVVSGPIELLKIFNPYYRQPGVVGFSSGAVNVAVTIDKKTNQQTILALNERRNGYIRAVNEKVFAAPNPTTGFPSERTKMIREVVEDFFPAAAIDEYEKTTKKKLTDKNLKKFMLDYKAKKLG